MGVKRTIYLGPYIEVRSPKKTETTDLCKNPKKCPSPVVEVRPVVDAFCSVCGVELKGRISEYQRRPDFIEILGNTESLTSCIDNCGKSPPENAFGSKHDELFLDCLVPKIASKIFERGDFWLQDDAQDMTDLMVGNEAQWMRKAYKSEISILRKTFGSENVRVRWGFLSYWS